MNFIAIDVLSNSYFAKQLDSLSEREPLLQLPNIIVVAPYHFKKEEGYFFM